MEGGRVYIGGYVTAKQAAKLRELARQTKRSQAAVLRILLEGATPQDVELFTARGPERPEGETSS